MSFNWKLQWHILRHWEYWSLKAIYYPLFPAWLFFSFKARSFFFFNAANPSIKNGGMAMESKMDIYDLMPADSRPETMKVHKNSSWQELRHSVIKSGINFPFIVKPDIGMKAFGVNKIENIDQLKAYFHKTPQDFLIQEFVPYPNEVGIFYTRLPEQLKGDITGIVRKEFLSVTGDGTSTILSLIKENPRSHLQLNSLKKQYGQELNRVLAKGITFTLVPFGSHTRGAKFTDETHKTTPSLQKRIDEICTKIPGFYYGRLDILFNSFDELCEGRNFKIIEINGAGSEATHIYDPGHSIFYAWKEIIKHWRILYEISRANRRKGHSYLSFKEGTAMLRANSKLEAQLKSI